MRNDPNLINIIIIISTLFFLLRSSALTNTLTVGHICVQIHPTGHPLISQPIKRNSLEVAVRMSNPFSCLRGEPYGGWRHRGQCIFSLVFAALPLTALMSRDIQLQDDFKPFFYFAQWTNQQWTSEFSFWSDFDLFNNSFGVNVMRNPAEGLSKVTFKYKIQTLQILFAVLCNDKYEQLGAN